MDFIFIPYNKENRRSCFLKKLAVEFITDLYDSRSLETKMCILVNACGYLRFQFCRNVKPIIIKFLSFDLKTRK